MAGIRIDDLDATVLPSRDHVVPAMKDGLTVKLTVGQILNLLEKVLDPDEVGSKALFAALNLSDLDDPAQARENLGATEIGDVLFTALSKEAARSTIDALGPSETADKAFRRGNIIGTVSQSGGTPTGALIERGSNANGEYVRYADGTQICWIKVDGLVPNVAAGQIFSSALVAVTFPAAFEEVPSVNVALRSAPRWGGISGNITTSGCEVVAMSPTSTATGITAYVAAIGRWF